MQHIAGPVPSLKARNSEVTDEFSEILQVAMAKTPERRQRSLDEFLRQLRSVKMYERSSEETAKSQ